MSNLVIERCNALERAEEIKALFLRNGRPSFPRFFDRAYPGAMSRGGASWVARDAQGVVVMHDAVFPRLFHGSSGTRRGGLLMDLIADPPYRNFWSAVELCRRLVADARALGEFDFLYADPTLPSVGALQAAGFTELSRLRRYANILSGPYLAFWRLRTPAPRLVAERRVGDLGQAGLEDAARALASGSGFRADRSGELYAAREHGNTIPSPEWLVLRTPDGVEPVALGLMAPDTERQMMTCCDVLWDAARTSLPSVLHAVARGARQLGFRRLSLWTLEGSALARAATACGFLARRDALPLLVVSLKDGARPLPPVAEWLMTFIDGSAW